MTLYRSASSVPVATLAGWLRRSMPPHPGHALVKKQMADLPAEAALAVACIRSDLGPGCDEMLTTALSREIDWEHFVRFTLDHAITELVFLPLCARCQAGVPEAVLVAATQRLERRRHEAKAAQAQLQALMCLLDDHRIPVLLFK